MVKDSCRESPCHSPEELRRRASRPGIPIDDLIKELKELAAESKG